ncbi:MAG TPA: CcmD family protein [Ohtaekwangia sp.]|uniref:CcmD family protein n=1 Tax=Ohtaekwangia sp. TaxID=2066019 RepID=UPI002F93367B
MEKILKSFFALAAIVLSFSAQAQSEVQMADTMRSEGKIYVVVSIILIILVGLIAYLFLMDRKVKKLEERLAEKQR